MTLRTLKYNTAIAAMMALLNDFYKKGSITKGELKTFLYSAKSGCTSYHRRNVGRLRFWRTVCISRHWPEYDEAKTVENTVEIAVQINGKTKGTVCYSAR